VCEKPTRETHSGIDARYLAGVLYHLRHPLLGLERIEHAKANGGRAHLGRKPSYTREQFDTVHAMLGGQTVGTCDDTVEAYNRARQSVRPARLMSDLLRVGEMLCTDLWTLRPPQPLRNCAAITQFLSASERKLSSLTCEGHCVFNLPTSKT
jgi:hypothetical protein